MALSHPNRGKIRRPEPVAHQLTFDLPSRPALGQGDFFVSPSNQLAADAVQVWHDWPHRKMLLIGPKGSGKTHLTHVWAQMADARILASLDLAENRVEELAQGHVAVEDVPLIAGNAPLEQALFHLHNLILANGHALLMTATTPPVRWGLGLPDLASRMQGTASVTLDAPDDTLLGAVLVKLFNDRQLAVPPRVISWLTARMDRSFAAAGAVVEALDMAALAEGRPVTTALAAEVLDKLGHPPA